MKAALQTFLKEHESVIAPVGKEYALAVWGSSTLGTPEAEERTAKARKALLSVYADKAAFEKVKWFRSVGTTGDELLDRQLTLAYNAFAPNQMPPEMIAELVDAEKGVESLFHNYRAEFEGRHATDNELKDLLRHEADPARRKTVWEATKQIGAKAAPLVLKVVRLRNEIARTEGFRDHFAMALHFQELDEPKLFKIFDDLRESTRLPFRKAKSEIDQAIAKLARIPPAELRPWHYEDPFFQEAPAHGTMSLEKYFRSADPVALTMDTFRKFGFDVSDIIARSDLYEREGKEQHAFCIHIDKSGDVRVLANVKNDEYWTGTMLHEVGHAVYDKHLDPSLPYLLREPAHTLTTEAVAMMIGRLNRSVEWITEELSVSENEAKTLQAPLRNALHAKLLIFIRWAMVVTEFEREMYGNPDADLQAIWWSLVEKNQEIHVDPERKVAGATHADWASKIHISLFPVYYQNYVLGELMASQLGRALAKGVGSHKPGVYVGKKGVADWLTKNLFHLGARYRWDDTILRATGEHLNPRYLLADETA